MEKEDMKTLDAYNSEYKRRFKEFGLENYPAGVLCPLCMHSNKKNEMFFIDKCSTHLTIPTTQSVQCSACSYEGKILVGELK